MNIVIAVLLVLGVAGLFGFGAGKTSATFDLLQPTCKEAGGSLEEVDDQYVCWDAINKRVVPITIRVPLANSQGGLDG